jgi:hypothetical protein
VRNIVGVQRRTALGPDRPGPKLRHVSQCAVSSVPQARATHSTAAAATVSSGRASVAAWASGAAAAARSAASTPSAPGAPATTAAAARRSAAAAIVRGDTPHTLNIMWPRRVFVLTLVCVLCVAGTHTHTQRHTRRTARRLTHSWAHAGWAEGVGEDVGLALAELRARLAAAMAAETATAALLAHCLDRPAHRTGAGPPRQPCSALALGHNLDRCGTCRCRQPCACRAGDPARAPRLEPSMRWHRRRPVRAATRHMPASSAQPTLYMCVCMYVYVGVGLGLGGRVCEFHNLYYSADAGRFFVVLGPTSIVEGVPDPRLPPANATAAAAAAITVADEAAAWSVDLSSLPGHPALRLEVDHVAAGAVAAARVHMHAGTTVLLARFHPHNLMHTLHDDVMPLFYLMRRLVPPGPYVVERQTHTHTHTRTHTHTCTPYTHTHARTHTHTHTRTHAHAYPHAHAHIRTHAHIHTHTLSLSLSLSIPRCCGAGDESHERGGWGGLGTTLRWHRFHVT